VPHFIVSAAYGKFLHAVAILNHHFNVVRRAGTIERIVSRGTNADSSA
jgi:hypothetical protein